MSEKLSGPGLPSHFRRLLMPLTSGVICKINTTDPLAIACCQTNTCNLVCPRDLAIMLMPPLDRVEAASAASDWQEEYPAF